MENTNDYYFDQMIAVTNMSDLYMFVIVSTAGYAKCVAYDDNFFSPSDLVLAYTEIWGKKWAYDEEFDECLENFKEWIRSTGADPDEAIQSVSKFKC